MNKRRKLVSIPGCPTAGPASGSLWGWARLAAHSSPHTTLPASTQAPPEAAQAREGLLNPCSLPGMFGGAGPETGTRGVALQGCPPGVGPVAGAGKGACGCKGEPSPSAAETLCLLRCQ